jgi:drug/metabolite transporter (DMT)-like permease
VTRRAPSRTAAVLLALLVTFLWSTSWVLIKLGLGGIPPLTFAGLRYGLAFLLLLAVAWPGELRAELRRASRRQWAELVLLGLLFYTLTQGAQFVGLAALPAVTVNLVLALQPLLVGLLGLALLGERLALRQWLGVSLAVAGAWVYFAPAALPSGGGAALAVVAAGALAGACSSVLGRDLNRGGTLSPLTVTVVSMGVGSALLLAVGPAVEGPPRLTDGGWAILAWLAVVNTALAFTLWNHTLRVLTAAESSVLNNTMVVQVAILARVFLGETVTPVEGVGLALVAVGAAAVQLRATAPSGWWPRRPGPGTRTARAG